MEGLWDSGIGLPEKRKPVQEKKKMNFIYGTYFWLLPVALLVVLALIFYAQERRRRFLSVLSGKTFDGKMVNVSRAKRMWRNILFLLAVLFGCFAALRPWWGESLVPYTSKGRDVMVVFDVSKSMLATDLAPSRLEHARQLLREVVAKSPGDRFGLIVFAGRAYLECPLTSDSGSFNQYIKEISTSSMPFGGTNVEIAVEVALQALEASEGESRAILLLSDGDSLDGDTSKAIDLLKKAKVPLFVVGLGNPQIAALVPDPDNPGSFKRDSAGELAKSKLNEPLLQEFAQASGGIYVRSTITENGAQALARAISGLGTSTLEEGEKSFPIDRFHYFVALSLIFLVLYLFLSERPMAWRRKSVMLLGVFAAVFTEANAAETVPGAESIPGESDNALQLPPAEMTSPSTSGGETEEIPSAVALYNQALEDQQNDGQVYQAGYAAAIAAAENHPEVRQRAFYNLGLADQRRASFFAQNARQQLQAQNPDAALTEVDSAEKELENAESWYIKAFSVEALQSQEQGTESAGEMSPSTSELTSIAQQRLLDLRKELEELRKAIEELKKQQEEARKAAEEAQKQNQQQQQNQQNGQDQQQQQNQQNGQDQQEQQNQQNGQDQAQQAAEAAQQAAEKLQELAEKLQQSNLAEAAKGAAQDFEDARKEQQEKNYDEAAKKLQEALKKLGVNLPDDAQQNQKGGDGQEGDSENQEQQAPESGATEEEGNEDFLPEQQEGVVGEAKDAEIDKEQARALLEIMAEREQEFRDAVKRQSLEGVRLPQPEKDW